jgi:hypothetical protein
MQDIATPTTEATLAAILGQVRTVAAEPYRTAIEYEVDRRKDDAAIPHRLIVTYRLLPGQPNFIAEFTNWDSQARLSDADFAFQPPADAKRIDLAPAAAADR